MSRRSRLPPFRPFPPTPGGTWRAARADPGPRGTNPSHAGYDYSGRCAAWAYSCLDLAGVRRVFLLGPSHTYYLEGCAVSAFAKYATPFGDLAVDGDALGCLKQAGAMADIPRRNDEREHSLEMHLPYLWVCCERTFASPRDFPAIVPVLVGGVAVADEKAVGRLLAPLVEDPANAFIVSSDFCHWGYTYQYTVYSPDRGLGALVSLDKHDDPPQGPPIHDSIRWLDEAAMEAVAGGKHDAFVAVIHKTHNTVCGRHPIGVVMAALELLANEAAADGAKYRFKVVQYDRSNLVTRPNDFSVSYVSAYAVS